MEKSIFSKIRDFRTEKSLSEEEKKKKKKEEQKLKKLKEKENEAEIRYDIFDVREELNTLEQQFDTKFRSESKMARLEKEEGIKNSRRYAQIATAFYCHQIVQEAKKRLDEQADDFELKSMIDSMQDALGALEELNGNIGTWSVKKLKQDVKGLSSTSTGANQTLVKTVNMLNKLKLQREDQTPIQNLVNYETIDRWLDDIDYAKKCWKTGEGVDVSPEQIFSVSGSDVSDDEPVPDFVVKDKKEKSSASELLKRIKNLED